MVNPHATDTPAADAERELALGVALPPVLPQGQRGRRTAGSSTPGSADSSPAEGSGTLAANVAERLRQLIIDGTLVPGVWLNERELCERLQVSRTPLREAYRVLAADGLVQLLPKRGAQVVAMSPEEVADIFDVLAVLEGLTGRLAAERATDAELDGIAALHRSMRAAYRARDIGRYYEASMGTHLAVSAAAHNDALADTHRRLNLRVQNLRYRSNLDTASWRRAVAAHDAFVAALLARDAATVETLMREHALEKKAQVVGRECR
ncbi:GntR family transcriptional regulator [Cupriavidus sp. AU9028]|uniref:GntR family transcriptional regulator n=1 Tax=Cupriavidus sp. AU9028 TaxID=2871157 RepID=UPI001C989B8C|nr:GntR family transcriptional regulator [Cupriavidus sp. AU9028]MBY4896810.1 GntR family transcriptional regulator [Cupriavidus sp. AU9028]